MNKKHIALVLLRKCFESGDMTDPDIAETFGLTNTTIRQIRIKWGYSRPEKITCNACGEQKAPNCFNAKYPGICIMCRRKFGIETRVPHGGRPWGNKKTVKRVCLKCEREFDSPVGYGNKPIHYLCERCSFVNGFLGYEEEQVAIRM